MALPILCGVGMFAFTPPSQLPRLSNSAEWYHGLHTGLEPACEPPPPLSPSLSPYLLPPCVCACVRVCARTRVMSHFRSEGLISLP